MICQLLWDMQLYTLLLFPKNRMLRFHTTQENCRKLFKNTNHLPEGLKSTDYYRSFVFFDKSIKSINSILSQNCSQRKNKIEQKCVGKILVKKGVKISTLAGASLFCAIHSSSSFSFFSICTCPKITHWLFQRHHKLWYLYLWYSYLRYSYIYDTLICDGDHWKLRCRHNLFGNPRNTEILDTDE